MGVSCQIITVHHESWVATLEISIPETWKKSNFYQLVKNHFWGVCQNDYNFTEGGYGEMITVLHRGGYAQILQYYIGGEGSRGTPKNDYVICARPPKIDWVLVDWIELGSLTRLTKNWEVWLENWEVWLAWVEHWEIGLAWLENWKGPSLHLNPHWIEEKRCTANKGWDQEKYRNIAIVRRTEKNGRNQIRMERALQEDGMGSK